MQLLYASLLAMVYTNDLFTAYVFIEIAAITACIAVVAKESGKSVVASIRYLVFSCLGSGLVLLGISILYSITGNLLALSESVFFACLTVSSKKAAGDNPLGLTALGNLFTGILVLAAFPASTATVVSLHGMDWALMLVLGVVQLGCGYAFYNMGVQRTTPQKASLLALWEMLLGPVWVAIFLQEYPSATVLMGFAVILLGMVIDALLPQILKKRA
jgi:drug/metabolite transporter (DMT)-like permease